MEFKWQQFIDINNKTGHHYNQYLKKFKVFLFIYIINIVNLIETKQ